MGKDNDQTVTQQVQIPGFLRPFLTESADVGRGALQGLESILGGGRSLIAGFDPVQEEALARQEALARGDILPTATNALEETARGDFLFGGPGFDQAVEAAVRAAQPGILSSFGRAGRGVSGLAQAAVAEQATDAFARLFDQERGRQLSAATALPNIALAGPNILSQTGAQRQAQTQRELQGPLTSFERLLRNATGVTASQSPLFGSSTTQPVGGSKLGDALGIGLSLAGLPIGGGTSLGGGLLGSAFGLTG